MKTIGFSFSVMKKDLDRFIRGVIPNSFKSAVKDLRSQLERENLPTSCLSHSFLGNTIHVCFVSLATDRPIAIFAIEFTRLKLFDDQLRAEFDRYYKKYGARNFNILDPRKHASEQI